MHTIYISYMYNAPGAPAVSSPYISLFHFDTLACHDTNPDKAVKSVLYIYIHTLHIYITLLTLGKVVTVIYAPHPPPLVPLPPPPPSRAPGVESSGEAPPPPPPSPPLPSSSLPSFLCPPHPRPFPPSLAPRSAAPPPPQSPTSGTRTTH